MPGWSADGTTRRHWRQCRHLCVQEGRCVDCRAKPVEDFQQAYHTSRGASVIGEMDPIISTTRGMDLAHMKGDDTSRDRFMPPLRKVS